MRAPRSGVLFALLAVTGAAQTPLTYAEIQTKARPAPAQARTQALLADRGLQLQETRGFLREGPGLTLAAGPRRTAGLPNTSDRAIEVDVPLFLSPRLRAGLETALGAAHPLLLEASRREALLSLRAAYLDSWLAERALGLRETDLATVERWLQAARIRFEAGADPAFQMSLVEGERLKARLERDEARMQQARAWAALAALAELPSAPVPLADPGDLAPMPTLATAELNQRLAQGPLRQALLAQAELETQSLRLKEAQALSRWSLRASYAREGDDRVSRLGVAVRLPRPGEGQAQRRSTEAQLQAVQGETRLALAELAARTQAILTQLTPAAAEPIPDFAQAVSAVGLRLQEGKERPSEALPIRRQFLEAQLAALRSRRAQHLLAAELQTLMPEVHP